MTLQWTETDFRTVTIFTLLFGLLFGTLTWLVLGLWFEWFGFWQCWLGATVISWPVAIVRVGNKVGVRDGVPGYGGEEDEFAASEEVRSVLEMIDIVENEEGAEGFRHIKGLVVELAVGEADKTISSMRDDGLSARALTFLLVLNVLGEELTSGKYHIYRGVLSTGGKMLLRLWVYAVEQQKQSGFYDEEKAKEELQWIMDQVKQVG